jgi:hypothetical protein
MNRAVTKKQLSRVLAIEETDGAMDATVRAFWTRAQSARAKALPPGSPSAAVAQVISLQQWSRRPRAPGVRLSTTR